ncbi:MAG: TonB-dependent receptor plug domain-containing protein [Gemmatimonadetes bacterium]|nr:TonB-dependent receptor plug domain-containing protein [Gemmatimonadota bacterium]
MIRRSLSAIALLLAAWSASAYAQSRVIFGRVIDSTTTEPLDHGLIRVLGTPIQGQVQKDGSFILYVPIREVTLKFEGYNYHNKEVVVPYREETVILPVRRDYFRLSTMVVLGQSSGVERRNLPNSIAQVSSEDLSRTPSPSVDDALRGKVNGAIINRRSGAPGGGITMRLRGVSTILGNADPLYIVDGVIVSNVTIPGGVNAVTQAQRGAIASDQEDSMNRIADLNPNDIESVEILKGASAAAMYGSKASNGVVIIKTKHGRFIGEN